MGGTVDKGKIRIFMKTMVCASALEVKTSLILFFDKIKSRIVLY